MHQVEGAIRTDIHCEHDSAVEMLFHEGEGMNRAELPVQPQDNTSGRLYPVPRGDLVNGINGKVALARCVDGVAGWLAEHQEALVDRMLAAVWRDAAPDSPLGNDPGLLAVVRSETTALLTRFVHGLSTGQDGPIRSLESRHIARLAALHEMPLEDVIAGYRVAHRVIEDALFEAVYEAGTAPGTSLDVLRHCCRQLFTQFEALIELVTAEYLDETEGRSIDENTRRLRATQSVLAGKHPVIALPFYDLDAEHVAVVARGATAHALATFAQGRGRTAVCLYLDRSVVWAWFSAVSPEKVRDVVFEQAQRGWLGIGEPAWGVAGFRRSHAEARSAYRVSEWTGQRAARFADVSAEAIGLADVDAALALVHRHLGQLAGEGRRKDVLRETLEVYLASQQTLRYAAAKLGLTERTVANRLAAVRELLPPNTELSSLELALALRLRPLVTRPDGPARGVAASRT